MLHLHLYDNTFAFEDIDDGLFVIRWHYCDGYLGYLSVSDLYNLRDIIETTINVYETIGFETDEQVQEYDHRCYEDYILEKERNYKPIPKPKKEPKKDHLYIIRDLDFHALKVGRSISPESRLKGLATSAANHMELVKVFHEMGRFEEKAHGLLKEAGLHLRSEWFTDSPQVFQIIETLINSPE